MANAGYDVTLLSVFETSQTSAWDAELLRDSAVRHITLRPHSGRDRAGANLHRLRMWIARRLVRFAGWQVASTLGPIRPILQAARRSPANLTIVHNEAPFWVGAKLLTEGRKVAADFEDWYSEDLLPEARRFRPLRLLRRLERELLHRAAYTSTTSHALASALVQEFGGNEPTVITNSFPRQVLPSSLIVGNPPAFFWFSQTIGPGRGLEEFLRAWENVQRPSRLVLLGQCDPQFAALLRSLAPSKTGNAIEFLPLVSPAELPAVIARYDYGLALEKSSPPSRDLTITNKVLQYLNAGLAVVASDTSGQREVFAQRADIGALVALDQPNTLRKQLDELLAAPGRLPAMKAASRQAAHDVFSWEAQSPTLLRLAEQALTP